MVPATIPIVLEVVGCSAFASLRAKYPAPMPVMLPNANGTANRQNVTGQRPGEGVIAAGVGICAILSGNLTEEKHHAQIVIVKGLVHWQRGHCNVTVRNGALYAFRSQGIMRFECRFCVLPLFSGKTTMTIKSNYNQWQYGEDGPGGGSVPYNVMATGAIAPFSPLNARRDIQQSSLQARTRIPVGMRPGMASQGPFPAAAAAPSVADASDMMNGSLGRVLGADASGRPIRHFAAAGAPSVPEASRAVSALRQMAEVLRSNNVTNLAPPLVSGPLAALARGEAIVLRWPNGVALTAAL